MLEIRPNCELCDKDLPLDSMEACICTYECTFCAPCVEDVLHNVCPNCGGGFEFRPVRPSIEHRAGVSAAKHKPSLRRVLSKFSQSDIVEFAEILKDTPPELR